MAARPTHDWKAMLEIAHHIPGRIRLRVRDAAVADGCIARLTPLSGIRRIIRRRYSLIIEYDPTQLPADTLHLAASPPDAGRNTSTGTGIVDAVLAHLVERLLVALVASIL